MYQYAIFHEQETWKCYFLSQISQNIINTINYHKYSLLLYHIRLKSDECHQENN